MGYSLENWCCLCCQHEEMMHHLFLSCSFSRKIWSHFFSKLGYNWSPPSTLQDLVASWLSLRFNLQSFGRYADVGVLEWCRIDAMSPLVLDINWWSSAVGVMLLELWNCCWSFAARAMQLLLKFCNNC
ncbi:hypothetical protein LINPERHAP1_LOCUS13204 [Linum perenne]